MMSKLWHNAVITSAIEFFCLPCECHLRSIQDAELHVVKPVHRKALEAAPYSEGHEEDRIRKVPSGYYCEFCNLLFTTSSKVGLHIVDRNHMTTKGQQLLKRDNNTIVAYNNISISDKAWNGFRGKTCVVCSKDFVFENIHKSEKEHILRLIQSKIEFGERKSIYRKIDDGYIQCLTCNEEFLQDAFHSHFNSLEHNNKYEESKITVTANVLDENDNIKGQEKVAINGDSKKVNEKPSGAIRKDTEKPKETIKSKAEIKKDTAKPQVKKDTKNISKNKTTEAQDPYNVDKKFCEVLKADNYISDLVQPFCILCEVDIKEGKALHLASNHHMMLLKLHKERLAKMKENATTVVNDPDVNVTSEQKEQDQESNEGNIERINDNKDKILESINELTKQGINVNFESSVATCKTCKTDLEFDYDFIIEHIEQHKKVKKEKFDLNEYKDVSKNTKLFSEPVVMKKEGASANVEDNTEMNDYAKRHGLELKDNVFFCGICGVNLTASLKQLKGHVNGKGHKNRTSRQSRREIPERALAVIARKVPMKDFIKEFQQVENLAFNDIIINFKYCINVLSFFMFTRYSNRLRCQVCRVNLNLHDVDTHKMEPEHIDKMQNTLVVTSISEEFIREVQPAVLHCGYCNLAVSETDLNNHLLSTSHKEIKRTMLSRLNQYLPEIQQHRRQTSGLHALFMLMLARAARAGNFFEDDDDDDDFEF